MWFPFSFLHWEMNPWECLINRSYQKQIRLPTTRELLKQTSFPWWGVYSKAKERLPRKLQWNLDFTIVDLTINILCLGKLYGAKSRFNNRTPVQQYSLYNDGNLVIHSQRFSRYNDIINITNHKRVRTTVKCGWTWCYAWIDAFVIHLPIAIIVNKVLTVQLSYWGNLLILLTALGKSNYWPFREITIL